eukprot:scaffold250_cov298-Pavlova_lutheri.AAC.1
MSSSAGMDTCSGCPMANLLPKAFPLQSPLSRPKYRDSLLLNPNRGTELGRTANFCSRTGDGNPGS